MSDEDNERTKQGIEEFWRRVETAEPMMAFAMHEIVRIETIPTGEALIDFVFAKSVDDRATIARLAISKEAAQAIKAALVANKNIPDMPLPKRDPRSTN